MPPVRAPRVRRRRAPGLVLVGALLAVGAVRAEPAPVVEYLTVDASEAGASGGHAALRLGARVFHFEAEGGRLRLAREPWPDFRFRYRVLENRSLRAQRIAVPPDTAAALERYFDRRLWTEAAHRERLGALERDVHLLEALAGGARTGFPVPGAGFFERAGEAGASRESAGAGAIRALRRRIVREHGAGFAAERLARARASLRDLSPGPPGAEPDSRPGTVPTGATLSERYAELLAAIRALETLHDAPRLREVALAPLPDPLAATSPEEARALRAGRDALETRLVRLVASQRPDWGAAFALGMARLAALTESLDRGRLVVLDALPPDARRVDAAAVRRVAGPLGVHLEHRLATLARARSALRAAPEGERALSALEAAASRAGELARALRAGRDLRVAPGPLVPRRPAVVAPLPMPDFVATGVDWPLAAARERLRSAREDAARRYGYDLVANNCVTAIFREVEAATGSALALARGGDPLARSLYAARFVPFVSASLVERSWPVAAERTLASHRRERLARLGEREPGWLVALRESNTLTSTLYEANPVDSPFVFFTDTSVWSRPLFGVANLAAGLVHGAAGVLRLPWDGGHHLARAARGIAASLPELVFVNVRKGSFPFALPPAASSPGPDPPQDLHEARVSSEVEPAGPERRPTSG